MTASHEKPPDPSGPRIAIVGAGVSGLACARRLVDAGMLVTVFDKARGSGGRLSTRRSDDHAFDHGAQYFTVRDPRFAHCVNGWRREGVVQEWAGVIVGLRAGTISPGTGDTRRFVGVPGMSAIGRRLATACDVVTGFRVDRVGPTNAGHEVVADDGRRRSGFDAVVVSSPAPQAARLLSPSVPALAARTEEVRFSACWAVLLAFEETLALPFDGAFVADSPLSWIARNSSKPGRPAAECWVLHGSPEWSDAHLEDAPEEVASHLERAFADAAGDALPDPVFAQAHRWAHALPTVHLSERFLFDDGQGIGACGDWCAGPRVEGAFLSGTALAERIRSWARG